TQCFAQYVCQTLSMFKPMRSALRRKFASRSSSPAYSPPLSEESFLISSIVSCTSASYSECENFIFGLLKEGVAGAGIKLWVALDSKDLFCPQVFCDSDGVSAASGGVEHCGVFIDNHPHKVAQHLPRLFTHVDFFILAWMGEGVSDSLNDLSIPSRCEEGCFINTARSTAGVG